MTPILGIGRQRDHVARASVRGARPHAAPVAHDHQPQGAVRRLVGFDQLQQLTPELLGILRQRDVEELGIALNPCPVTLPCEEHAIGDAQRGEDAPAG